MLERYQWADNDESLAWTVSVVEGRTQADIVEAFSGKPTPIATMTFDEARVPEEELGRISYLQILHLGRHMIGIENNRWVGQGIEVARRASANGGQFFSAYWNIEGRRRIVQAISGQPIANFDVALLGDVVYPDDIVPSWVSQSDFPTGSLGAACLAAMEKETGVAFDRSWLQLSLPTFEICVS